MSDTIEPKSPTRRRVFVGMTTKLAGLAALVLATLIPNYLTTDLITDRERSEYIAKRGVEQSWGPNQTVVGPMLLVHAKDASGDASDSYLHFQIAPKSLETEIEITPEKRHRGFFETTVYRAVIHMKGTFVLPDATLMRGPTAYTIPDTGQFAVTLSDDAGVTNADRVKIGGTEATWSRLPGGICKSDGVLVVPTSLAGLNSGIAFEATLHLRGSESLAFVPLAKALNARVKGGWSSPGFFGDEPPEKTAIGKDGFAAQWRLDDIGADAYAAATCFKDRPKPDRAFGISLVDPVPTYRMVMRAAKYAPLFVVIAFASYFLFELVTGVRIAMLQYALMAASLSLFALLLVAFSEFTGYREGYVIAAALVTVQASLYTASVARRVGIGIGFAALLSGLFGLLYVLLGLETFALLAGAVALFVLLSLVMAATQAAGRRAAETA